MTVKLFDSELKVMDVLWRDGDRTAREIAGILGEEIGWNTKTEVQAAETEALIGKLFDGSPDLLFASLLDSRKLSVEQLERLKKLVTAMEQEHRS